MSRDRRIGVSIALILILGPSTAIADPPDPSPAPVEVTAKAAPRRRDPSRVTVSAEEARKVPGTQGDALKVVESLPGVGRSAFGAGQIVVWGAAPGDTKVYLDDVEIPALYHQSGLRGTVNADLIQSLDLTPGAYGAEYGRGLGGIIRLRTRDLPEEGIHGYLGADLLDASALVSAAVSNRIRVAVAGRISYLDRILSGVVSPEVSAYFPIPRYRDYQARAEFTLREDEALALTLVGSGDEIDRTQPSTDPARTRRDSLDTSFHRAILRYTRTFADNSTVSATPFFGQDRSALDASFGAVPQRESNISWKYGIRASYRARLTEAITASIGMDALGSTSSLARAGSLTLPPREGDLYVFGQPPGADVNADAWTSNIVNVGPYVLAEVRLGPVILTPGLRADAFLIEGSRVTPRVGETPAVGFSRLAAAIDPRLSVSWAWTPRITVSASAGIYHAPPRPEDLSAVFGTPALSLSRAIHAALSEAVRFDKGFSLELTGYYRDLDHLVVRTRLPTPQLAQALTQDGEGRSYGVSVLVRRQLQSGLYGWLSYTASRSERRYRGDAAYRLFDFDQTHVISAVAGYERNGWGGGLRVRYATGMPRTPVVGAFYEATAGEFQPIFGDPNSARLPPFFSLDLRLEKKLDLGKTAVRFSLDVINVTMRKNPEEVVYSDDYEKRSYITGLPTLGVLGVRVER